MNSSHKSKDDNVGCFQYKGGRGTWRTDLEFCLGL